MREREKSKNKKTAKRRTIVLLIVLAILIAASILTIKIINNKKSEQTNISNNDEVTVKIPEKKINIYSGNDRPIAVMIDNNTNAWPQAGIDKAYMVYEIIVEGGETRLMAVFKGQDVDKIGPIRSSRHYFLDYALENDAIYAHLGWSPLAESQISSLGINNINGQAYDTGKARTNNSKFWRETGRNAPHNAFTNTKMILEIASDKKYRTTSNEESILNYVTDEVTLEEGMSATKISIPYNGNSNVVKYEYDEENKVYSRYSKGKEQKEATSGNTVTTKNIIITLAKNYALNDAENKGRQNIDNIGTLDGYYITNGKAIKITCTKTSKSAKTVYKDLNGEEIKVNDGNTFVQICPIDANVVIEGVTETPSQPAQ